jgi:hypothetical protein
VLAVVQYHQHLGSAQRVGERLLERAIRACLDIQCGRKPVRDEGRIGDLRQLNDPHSVAILFGHAASYLDGKPCLAGTSRTGECDESCSSKPRRKAGEFPLATDEACQCDGQTIAAEIDGLTALRAAAPPDWFDCRAEAIRVIRR